MPGTFKIRRIRIMGNCKTEPVKKFDLKPQKEASGVNFTVSL